MATTALTTAAEGAGRSLGKGRSRPIGSGASQGDGKSWVAKDASSGARGDWQAWRGQRNRAWSDPAKKEELGSLDVYSRDLLLQFHVSSTPSTSAPSSESPGSSPRSLGSFGGLYCAPLDQLSEKNRRERCNSEELPAEKSRCGSEELPSEKSRCGSEDAAGDYTTVVLRGVPKELGRTALCERLSEHGFGHDINFLHLPSAGEVGTQNAGYVSVNLRTKEARESFCKTFYGVKVSVCFPDCQETSDELCQVEPSEVQGLERNMESLCTPQNIYDWSRQGDAWQPLFLDEDGARVPMPMPGGGRPRAASDPTAGAPGLAAPGLPAPPQGAGAGSDQFMAYMSYMHMQHMQAQMQMQFMQQQMLRQQKAAQLAKKAEQDKKNKQMSASSPEFKPAASPELEPAACPDLLKPAESKPVGDGMRAEAPAFVPSA